MILARCALSSSHGTPFTFRSRRGLHVSISGAIKARMDYHLHQNGKDVGVFQLEDLRRRVEAGELTGVELVWTQGMANWEPLSVVLQRAGMPMPAGGAPPALSVARAPRSNRWVIPVVIGAVVIGLVIMGLLGFTFLRLVQRAGWTKSSGNDSEESQNREGSEAAGKALEVGTNVLTEADVRKRGQEFRTRQYIAGYRNNADHTAAWDGEARELIETWFAYNYGSRTNWEKLQSLSDKLAALPGCDEPLVLTVAASEAIEVHEKIQRLERALAVFDKSRHKGYPKFFAAVSLATQISHNPTRLGPLDDKALRYLEASFKDGSFEPRDEEEIAELLINGWAEEFFKRNGAALERITSEAKGFEWLSLVVQGEYEINRAWKSRGSGYANTVDNQAWKGFAEHLEKAETALTRAWKLQPRRPLPAALMLTVAMGQNGADEMRMWFDRAVSAQIDYPAAWSKMRWGMRPRWHGSPAAQLALGARAVDTKRFDTDVPRKLFDCVRDIELDLELTPGEHIYGRADVWPELQRMYEGYIAEPSQAETRPGWRSTYAAVAFLAGHPEVARTQLEAVNWQPVRINLTDWGKDLSLMPLQVAGLTGKAGARVAQAEKSYEQFRLNEAIRIYSEIRTSAEADERTKGLCRSRLAGLEQEQRLAKNQWVDWLPESTNDVNWACDDEKLRRLEDGALEVESGPRGHGMYCRTRVGPSFEVTGEVEVVRSSNQDFQAGILIGLADNIRSEFYSFRIKRNATEGKVVSLGYGFSRRQVSHQASLDDRRNELRLRMQNGEADAWVNGTQVLHKASPVKDLKLRPDTYLGLGAYNDMNTTVLRYRNIKVRRLP